ncbi:hypothetical protein TIFTF001_040747 [Ficus carica]|uniref:Uncharacterized protein n=1 Tax=Ficus carica TaxID=3494 RepID=A0AA87YXZ2_FICCA|nr:hypothetical protein TIFTF001_040726 [Ficus carica]GMN25561.1 hypothetical protein TIFTF001_040729 [Ficus carica]GMN25591.1 hypothetical protein TIFTF001_040736 [Ficus carica]GMN25612.1 hypothetical protein TIFTF001_040747 [Ficus carica]
MFGWFNRNNNVSRSSTHESASTRGWHWRGASIDLLMRLIISHTVTPCVVGGPMGEGRPVRARPYDGFAGSCSVIGGFSLRGWRVMLCDWRLLAL